ncbi:MAG: ATPase [Rhodobacteraceae bacterium]|nr:ATPase [Paracoccaceae bacterium]
MLYNSAKEWHGAAHKRVALIGMSGLGKTYLSEMLRGGGEWYHYSVDYRIGTRYMDEHIVDNFKREAMKVPFLRELLRSDSIYIASNITFENLAPLSSYLGKPGDAAKGGIAFDTYQTRQNQHRLAEQAAVRDTPRFADKAVDIYGYRHFVCDTSGSICEVVDGNNPDDPVLKALSAATLPVWIKGNEGHTTELRTRFDAAPKPMYYRQGFLLQKWEEYLTLHSVAPDMVDPDDFIRWGYGELLESRLPRYSAIAKNWGISIAADELRHIRDPQDFTDLIGQAIDRNS